MPARIPPGLLKQESISWCLMAFGILTMAVVTTDSSYPATHPLVAIVLVSTVLFCLVGAAFTGWLLHRPMITAPALAVGSLLFVAACVLMAGKWPIPG